MSRSYGPLTINGVNYGNPARAANDVQNYAASVKTYAQGLEKFLGHTMNLESGSFEFNTEENTIRIRSDILATTDYQPYRWLRTQEEAIPILDTSEWRE